MSGSRDLNADVDIDIMGLMSEVWKRRWLVFALTVLTGIALLFTLSLVDPRYKSNARILIEKRESVFTRRTDGDLTSSSNEFDEQAIGSQVQVLNSDDIALKVIGTLGLAKREEFAGSTKPSVLDNVLIMLGMKNTVNPEAVQAELLKAFHKRLSVFAADKSRVLVVEFWSHDPELAKTVPNAIANEYLEITKQAKLQSNVEATDWLGPEIDELRTKVRDAEAKVAEFRSSSDILVGNNNSLLATQQLSEASSELSRLRAERTAVEAKANSIRAALKNGGSLDAIPEVIASPLIQRLRERQVALQADISELSTTLLPNHPRIKALRSQLADFDVQIRNAAQDILRSLENNVDVVRAQETVLLKEVDRLKAEAARVGEAEVELRALEREASAQRELLESYLTQYREAASRQNREYLPVDARIISRAIRPSEPYFPKVLPFAIAGMVTMLVLSVVGILAWSLMTGRAFKPVGAMPAEFVPERVELPEAETPVRNDFGGEVRGRVSDLGRFEVSPPYETEIAPGPLERKVEAPAMSTPEQVDEPIADEPIVREPYAFAAAPAQEDEEEFFLPATGANINAPEVFAFRHAATAIGSMGSASIAVVSPAGDPGSVVARMLARKLAANGASVVVVDLTGTAVTSRQMLGEGYFAGLHELATGSVRFGEAVHQDRQSNARVLPSGEAEGEPIPPERLSSIADAMSGSYDFVLFDCGYTGPEGLKLVAGGETVVVVSCEGTSSDEAAQAATQFHAAGFVDTILVRLEPSDREAMPAGAAA